jgi:hypothetical protein
MVSSSLSDFSKYSSDSFLYSHVVNIYFTMSSVIFNIFLLFLSLHWLQLGVSFHVHHTMITVTLGYRHELTYIVSDMVKISHNMAWWIRDIQFGDFHICRWILLCWNSVVLTVVILVTAKSKIPFPLLFFSLCRIYFPIFGALPCSFR